MSNSPAPSDPLETSIQACPHCAAPIDMSELEPLARVGCPQCGGEVIVEGRIDHFELTSVAGRGGMGVVYKAYDQALERTVAVKLLRKEHSTDSKQLEQLQVEAAITASISHPNVVNVYSTGIDRGRFFLAMELVDQGSLADLIDTQGRCAEVQALEVGIQIAHGLNAALSHRLIHRDVKPGNILFVNAHTAKIVDFGLAIFMEQEESARGEIWGTPYYVAPEKLDNKPEDFRSDIYSLGATLFHALAGRPPFEAESPSMVALKHLKSQPVSLQAYAPHVSGRTAFVINRTLLKDPDSRYQSYEELIEHLEYARDALIESAGSKPQSRRVVLESAEEQKLWGYMTMGMVALVLAGLGAYLVFRKRAQNPVQEVAGPVAVAAQASTVGPLARAREKLAEGDPLAAASEFHAIAAREGGSPIESAWASFQEGIATLHAGNLSAAQKIFALLKIQGEAFTKELPTRQAGAIFVRTADLMKGEQSVEPAPLKQVPKTSPEVLAVLAAGLKNWHLGKTEESIVLLRQFREAAPTGEFAWIATLKPLVHGYIEEFTRFQMAQSQKNEATSPNELRAATTALQSFKGALGQRAKLLLEAAPVPGPVTAPAATAPATTAPAVTAPAVTAPAATAPAATAKRAKPQWTSNDIGASKIPGITEINEATGSVLLKAASLDRGEKEDCWRFVQQAMRGDFEMVVKIPKSDPSTRAGIAVRESMSPNARQINLSVLSSRLEMQWRAEPGGANRTLQSTNIALPQWLRMTRQGDRLTGFYSADGATWMRIAEQTWPGKPATLAVGLALAAPATNSLKVASFESVRLDPVVGMRGKLEGDATWAEPDYSVNLDGKSGFLALENGVIAGQDELTIAVRVRWNGGAHWQRIFDFHNDGFTSMYLTPQGTGKNLNLHLQLPGGPEDCRIEAASSLPIGEPKFLVLTFAGSVGTLYMDGVQVAQNPAMPARPGQLGVTAQNWIGRSAFPRDPFFNGQISNFSIYPRALSPMEVKSLSQTK